VGFYVVVVVVVVVAVMMIARSWVDYCLLKNDFMVIENSAD